MIKDEIAGEMGDVGIDDEDEEILDDDEEEDEEENFEDVSIERISKHTGAVFCIDSYKSYLATGGEDDLAYVFRYDQTGKKLDCLIETEKFKDSVTNVKFSFDGKYVAMADMSGTIRVYTVDTKELHWSHDVESDTEQLAWHPSCNVLFCSTSDGYFYMFKLSTNEIKMMYAGDNASLSCFRILKDGLRAVCCYNNGTVRFWDLKSTQSLFNLHNAHESDIICVDSNIDGSLIATGGTDMKINLINCNNGKIVYALKCPTTGNEPSEDDEEDSVESLSFSKTLPLLACATLSGRLIVWDVNTHSIRCQHDNDKVGYTKLIWTPSHEQLFASTIEGQIQIFDGRNLTLAKTIKCHKSEILDFSLDDTISILHTASNDNLVKLFKL